MNFLAMVLGLLLQQAWGGRNPVHRDDWFQQFRGQLASLVASPLWLTLLAIVLPALLLQLVLNALHPFLFGLAWIAVAALVLVYAFGRGDFSLLRGRYGHYCAEGDLEAAWLYLDQQLDLSEPEAGPEDAADFQRRAESALLYEGYQRWFPVLLYFLLLGPAGALLYRLAQLSLKATRSDADKRIVWVLDWLPSRLVALSFAVTGDFVRSRTALGRLVPSEAPAPEVLLGVARAAALSPEEPGHVVTGPDAAREAAELGDLLSRSAVLWVGLIALLELLV